MFGRDQSVAVVDGLLAQASGSTASAVTIIGDPGMGKTVLCEYACAQARELGFIVLSVTGMQWESRFELGAMTQIIRPLRRWFPQLSAQHRELLAAADSAAGASQDAYGFAAAALACIVMAAEQRPLLIVVDDAHWIDGTSVSVLTFIVRRLFADAVAVLIAQRAGEVERFPRTWHQHVLPPLTAGDVHDLIGSLRPDLPAVSVAVAETVRERAAGNPLIVAEIAPLLEVDQVSGARPLPDPLPLGERGQFSFGSRIAALGPRTRLALGVVAAAGSQVDLVPAALTAHQLSAADLDEAIESGVLLAGSSFRFAHPLYRAAAYAGARPSFRREVSATLAELNRDLDAERYAWHLDAAGVDPAHVADAFEAAALVIAARAGVAASATAWTRAATLTVDPTERRRRALQAATSLFKAGETPACRRWLTEILDVTAPQGDIDREVSSGAVLLTCQAAVWNTTDAASLAVLVDLTSQMESYDPGRAAQAYGLLSGAFENAGDLQRANELTDRAVQIAAPLAESSRLVAACWQAHTRTIGAGATVAVPISHLVPTDILRPFVQEDPASMWTVAQTAQWQEDFAFSAEVCQMVVEVLRRTSNIAWLPYALAVQAETMWWTGSWDHARAAIAEAVDLAQQANQQSLLGFLLATAGLIAASTGRDADCEDQLSAALEHAARVGLEPVLLYTGRAYGLFHIGRGRYAEAVGHLERAHQVAVGAGMAQPVVVPYLSDYAEALIRSGDISRGAEMVERLNAAASTSGSRWAYGTSLRCRAVLDPQTDESEDLLRRSIEVLSTALDAPFERYRTHLELGGQLRRRRRLADARYQLGLASAGFAAIGALPWVRRADAERRAAGDRDIAAPAAAGSGLSALSPQQLQVVLAVAAGASNKEAAAALFISAKTVDYHLRRAFTALGVRSRVEIARLVASSATSVDR